MPKPDLNKPAKYLINDLIRTFLAGHHQWRPDLPYPESHSDLEGGFRAVLKMFKIERRDIALENKDIDDNPV